MASQGEVVDELILNVVLKLDNISFCEGSNKSRSEVIMKILRIQVDYGISNTAITKMKRLTTKDYVHAHLETCLPKLGRRLETYSSQLVWITPKLMFVHVTKYYTMVQNQKTYKCALCGVSRYMMDTQGKCVLRKVSPQTLQDIDVIYLHDYKCYVFRHHVMGICV